MAFDINSFNNVTSGAAKGPRMYTYSTDADGLEEVLTADYFLQVTRALKVNDLLYVRAGNGAGWYVVQTASATTVVLGASEGAAHARVEIESAAVLALRAEPFDLVPSPGPGKVLVFERAMLQLDYNTTQYTESDDNLAVKYGTGAGVAVSTTVEATGFIDQAVNTTITAIPLLNAVVANSAAVGEGLVLHNTGSGEYAAGDSPLFVDVFYRVVNAV